jgi:hypothetical protein
MELSPDIGVPITTEDSYIDLRARAAAACETMALLEVEGLEIPEPNAEDKEIATALVSSYAADPEKTSRTVTHQRASTLSNPSLIATRAVLDEWGHAVVKHAVEIRHTVTNQLVSETQNPDPRIRIRALELLGKISDVGLFTDKQEITVTHQSTDDLRRKLKDKLEKLRAPIVEVTDVVEIGGDTLDVAEEMGLKEDPKDE